MCWVSRPPLSPPYRVPLLPANILLIFHDKMSHIKKNHNFDKFEVLFVTPRCLDSLPLKGLCERHRPEKNVFDLSVAKT